MADCIVDLDAIDATRGVDASGLLSRYGITVATDPPDAPLRIVPASELYDGKGIHPASGNMLTQSNPPAGQVPVSYTLTFQRPIDAVRFTRPHLLAWTGSGTIHPRWSAEALDADGRTVQQVGADRLATYEDQPAVEYLLAGAPIVALRVSGDNQGREPNPAAYLNVVTHRLTLVAPPDQLPVPEDISIRAGYRSDDPVGRDLLAFDRDIRALAAVLAAKDTTPPLAVGLFGEWGSGKSFFMRQLQARIRQLADETLKRRIPAPPVANAAGAAASSADVSSAYCGRIAHIEFNAWHYIEHNLYASLVNRVIEGLFVQLSAQPTDTAAGSVVHRLLELTQAKQALASATSKVEVSLAKVAETATTEVKDATAQVSRELTKPASEVKVSELLELSKELSTRAGQLRRGLSTTSRQARAHLDRVLLAVLVAALAAALGYAVLGGLGITVATLLSLTAVGGYLMRVVNSLLGAVNKVVDEAQAKEKEQIRKAAQDKVDEAQAAYDRAEEIRGKTVLGFVEQRYLNSHYQKELGIIAQIQKDFEGLSRTMREASSRNDANSVERIVLYIDDLDRCPPKVVVEVLQAVHLLLAFDLFVVVVGVDSRWLLRSLEHQYSQLAPAPDGSAQIGLSATPQDYLEKIFQIPYWVPRMNRDGYERLVTDLVQAQRPPKVVEHRGGPADLVNPVELALSRPITAGGGPLRAAPQFDLRPGGLRIEDQEADWLRRLGAFVRTPREAKRLVNLYRLLKVSLAPADSRQLFAKGGGDHPIVLLLVAALAGYPREGAELLVELAKANGSTDWSQFINYLTDAHRAKAVEQGDAAERSWPGLLAALRATAGENRLNDMTAFRRWVPIVSRFSFWGGLELDELPNASTNLAGLSQSN